MESELSAHEEESAQDSSQPWLAWYRRYLYFALILSALGVLLSITVFGSSSFGGALLDVVFTAFVLKSLKRLEEPPIKILHMTVNGAMLLIAIIGISGFGYQVPEMIMSLLTLLAVEYEALLVFGGQSMVMAAIVVVVFVLISIYWLWNLYQFSPPYKDHRDSDDQVANRSDDGDTGSSLRDD